MAGYWPSSFFCVFMDRDAVEVHKLAKTERGQYPAILTEQDSSILPARVANHSAEFDSSCLLAEWPYNKNASCAQLFSKEIFFIL